MAFRGSNKLSNWHLGSTVLKNGSAQMKALDEVLSAHHRFEQMIEKAEGVACVFSFKRTDISWARTDNRDSAFKALPSTVTVSDKPQNLESLIEQMDQNQKAQLLAALQPRKSKLIKAKR